MEISHWKSGESSSRVIRMVTRMSPFPQAAALYFRIQPPELPSPKGSALFRPKAPA